MAKVGQVVNQWVESQKDLAEAVGISAPTMNQMLKGKIKFPILRFIQAIYYLNPPQEQINKAFNIYLSRLDLPQDSVVISTAQSLQDETSEHTKIEKILDDIMKSDLDPAVKVKIYNIINNNK